jgi:hypothetical protein
MASKQKPNKRIRKAVTRIPVDFDAPEQPLQPEHAGPSTEREIVMVREEGQQPSTGRTYRSKPSAVVDDPWLPVEDAEIGLDPDGVKADEALAAEFVELEEDAADVTKEKKKKKKKSLASVSFTELLMKHSH